MIREILLHQSKITNHHDAPIVAVDLVDQIIGATGAAVVVLILLATIEINGVHISMTAVVTVVDAITAVNVKIVANAPVAVHLNVSVVIVVTVQAVMPVVAKSVVVVTVEAVMPVVAKSAVVVTVEAVLMASLPF